MQPSGFNISEPSIDTYILVVNGKPEGPYSIDELKARKVKPGDFVRNDYKEAHEVAELRQLFGFKKQALPLQYFGSFDQRAIAAVLDWLIVSAGFVFIAFAAMLIIPDKFIRAVVTIGIIALIPIAKIIYNTKMESSPKQGTYGKQLLGIRVCDIYGEQVSPSKALSRNLAKYVSTLTLFIGYLMCFFNKKQQCLHDLMADTLVIKGRLDS
jgi:uncharacterized RDD family membrane protein YckC